MNPPPFVIDRMSKLHRFYLFPLHLFSCIIHKTLSFYHCLIHIPSFSRLFYVSSLERQLHVGCVHSSTPSIYNSAWCKIGRYSWIMAEWSNEAAVPQYCLFSSPTAAPAIWPAQPWMPQAPLLRLHPVIVSQGTYLSPSQTLCGSWATLTRGEFRLASSLFVCHVTVFWQVCELTLLVSSCHHFCDTQKSTFVMYKSGNPAEATDGAFPWKGVWVIDFPFYPHK